jgi:hypothetical protein
MESQALHGDGIYYESGDRLWVNLYVPSTARWDAGGLQLEADSSFPDGDSAALKLTLKEPKAMMLSLRRPAWAGDGFRVAVNGVAMKDLPAAGSYLNVKRNWNSGDTVSLVLPKQVHVEPLSDNRRVAALMWGPLVLAGDLGPEPERGERTEGAPAPRRAPTRPSVPVLIAAERPVNEWLRPVAGRPGAFRGVGLGRDPADPHGSVRDVEFEPFYRVHRRVYAAYWDLLPPSEYEAKVAAIAAERERLRKLEAATVAAVPIGDAEAEKTFQQQGEETSIVRADGRAGRRAAKWFSYNVPIDASQPAAIVLTYNSDTRQTRTFEILVDGRKVGEQTIPRNSESRFFDVEYAVPADLATGKTAVVVRVQAIAGSETAPVFGLRTIRTGAR